VSAADRVRAELKAAYAELFPYRDPETMRISDDVLALGVWMLRREKRRKPTEPPE
jgi:hypothetical protein